jgi:hypothetical protein
MMEVGEKMLEATKRIGEAKNGRMKKTIKLMTKLKVFFFFE